jgi:TatD DNase family protein
MDAFALKLQRGTKSGVIAAAICGTFPGSDWDAVARYAAQFPDYIIPSYGLHPWWLNSHLQKGEDGTYLWEDDLRRRLESNQSAGVGECGLDKARRGLPSMDIQADVTLRHLRIAAELWRPCTLHCVRAYGRLLQVIQQLRSEQQEEQNESSPIVLHRFAGDASLVEGFSSLGCYFSISVHELKGPRAEWVEARSRAVAAIPADRLLLESDSPDYGDAQLGRGGDSFSSSSPLDVIHACELVAGIRGLSFHEVAQQTSHNFRHVFPLSAPAAPGKH